MAMFTDDAFLSDITFSLIAKDLNIIAFYMNLRGYVVRILLKSFSPIFSPSDSEVFP